MNEIKIYKDENQWCAIDESFIDLQESIAGFGHTPNEALEKLLKQKNKRKMKLDELKYTDVGRTVQYEDNGKREVGKIKVWNKTVIFVVYACNNDWDHYFDYTGQATKPEDLKFVDSFICKECKQLFVKIWKSEEHKEMSICLDCYKEILNGLQG